MKTSWLNENSNEITNAWSRFVSELPQLETIPCLVLNGGNVNVQTTSWLMWCFNDVT